MTEAELKAIEGRVAGATPGPWVANYVGSSDWEIVQDGLDGRYVALVWDRKAVGLAPNAAFIIGARTDVPALLAEVRRLRRAVVFAEANMPIDHAPGCTCRPCAVRSMLALVLHPPKDGRRA